MDTIDMNITQAQIAELVTEVERLKAGADNVIIITTIWHEAAEDEDEGHYTYSSNITPAQAYNIIKNGGYGLRYEPPTEVSPATYNTLPMAAAWIEDDKYMIDLEGSGINISCRWDSDQNKYIWGEGI